MSQVESNTLFLAVLATALIVYISCSSACQQRTGGFSDMMSAGMIMLGLKKPVDGYTNQGEGVISNAGPIRPLINQGATGAIQNSGPLRSLVTNSSVGAPPGSDQNPPPGQLKPGTGQPVRPVVAAGVPHVIDPRPTYGDKTVGAASSTSLKDLVNKVVGAPPQQPQQPQQLSLIHI